jgi:hypothetical protein
MLKTETLKERMDSNPRFSADLGKGQWVAAGFMGKPYKRKNIHPLRFAKGFRWKILAAADSLGVVAFEVRCIRESGCGYPSVSGQPASRP